MVGKALIKEHIQLRIIHYILPSVTHTSLFYCVIPVLNPEVSSIYRIKESGDISSSINTRFFCIYSFTIIPSFISIPLPWRKSISGVTPTPIATEPQETQLSYPSGYQKSDCALFSLCNYSSSLFPSCYFKSSSYT